MRSDIDEIAARVEADGVCVVPDFVPRDLLARIRARVDELNESERRAGNAFLESDGANQRVFNLVNKGEVFEDIVQHGDVMGVIGKLLGDFILSGFSSNTTGPGGAGIDAQTGISPAQSRGTTETASVEVSEPLQSAISSIKSIA